MKKDGQFKYDVAISFLSTDEPLARKLHERLSERLEVFVYYDRQEELVGTDGMETFSKTFRSESRIVVVLQRKLWGSTRWTRIEETAIKNRGFEDSWGFLIMIPLDSPPTVPDWYPHQRIWFDFELHGLDGAVTVIELRVREVGGQPKEYDPADHALRISKRMSDEKQRLAMLNSRDGVSRANQEVESLFSNIEKKASEISTEESNIRLGHKRPEWSKFVLSCWLYEIEISWECPAVNSLHNSHLHVNLSKKDRFSSSYERPNRIATHSLDFDLRLPNRYGWSSIVGDKTFFTSEQLAKHVMRLLLDLFQRDQPWKK